MNDWLESILEAAVEELINEESSDVLDDFFTEDELNELLGE